MRGVDSFGSKRAQLFASLDDALSVAGITRRDRENGQASFFDMLQDEEKKKSIHFTIPQIDEWTDSELLAYEKELLGFYITGHPLKKYEDLLLQYLPHNSSQLLSIRDGEEVKVGGIITHVRHTVTKRKNEKMAILTIEDTQGAIEVLVFPSVYEECSPMLTVDNIVYVVGKNSVKDDTPKILAAEIDHIERAKERCTKAIKVRITDSSNKTENIMEFKDLCQNNPGKCPIYISLSLSSGEDVIVSANERFKVTPSELLLRKMETLFGRDNLEIRA